MATMNEVSKLYVALLNRAVDSSVVNTYQNESWDATISKVIDTNPTVRAMSNQTFVEHFYKNALGKDNATDKAGIDFWVAEAAKNSWSKEQLTDAMLRSIDDYVNNRVANPTDVDTAGVAVFNAKVFISDKAGELVGGSANAAELTFGAGLENVTAANAQTAIDNSLKSLEGVAKRNPAPISGGTTATLSKENPDFLPTGESGGSGGESGGVNSTNADDIINAVVNGADSTLTGTTKIDAAGGFDRLVVDMKADYTGLTSGTGFIQNVEEITLNNNALNQRLTFNAQGIDNVYQYNINGAYGVNLENVAYNEYLAINLNGVKDTSTTSGGATSGGGTTNISFNTTPTGGRLNMSLTDVGYDSTDNSITNHKIVLGTQGTSGGANDATVGGIGQMQLYITGNNYADIVNTGVNRITIGGTGTLDTNLSSGVTYFNASNATGNLTVRAADEYNAGNNGNNIFSHFATGTGDDNVSINVSRLAQDALVDLGRGNDTLTLTGEARTNAEKQFYNFNTIENLVLANDSGGDSLLIDLGTQVAPGSSGGDSGGSGGDSGGSGGDSGAGNITTADRSASLKSITFEDGASAQITSLGEKNLTVTYNGATTGQKVLADHAGETNLILQGTDTKIGTGVVNLSNSKVINLDLTGQGFSGILSAGQATNLNITNFTADKKLELMPNSGTEKNDLSSVTNLSINTEAQDISGASVNLANADLASLNNVTLKGTGGVQFGELSNSGGITIDGSAYSGRLTTENIYAGSGELNITTKGAITTGNLTGANIKIDLSKSITTEDDQYNNDIGTIFIGNGASTSGAASATGSLTYITGISGTKGAGTSRGDDWQNVIVNAKNASITLNGQGGVDKFDIKASAFTTDLKITGDLGSVPKEEGAKNNYDQTKIDLSSTAGVKLDVSGLVVNNPNTDANKGVNIITSQGKDEIKLAQGANYDTVESNAGGNPDAKTEITTFTVGTGLNKFQTLSFDGVTIMATDNVTAGTLTTQLENLFKNGAFTAGAKLTLTGELETFNKNDWTITASSTTKTIKFESKVKTDVAPDLDFTFTGNAASDTKASNIKSVYTEGVNARTTAMGATATSAFAQITASANTTISKDYSVSIGTGTSITITIEAVKTAGKTVAASAVSKIIAAVLEGKAATTAAIGSTAFSKVKLNGATYTGSSNQDYTGSKWHVEGSASGKLKLVADDPKTTEGIDISVSGGGLTTVNKIQGQPVTEATTTKFEVTFNDLKAGQTYTLDGKTVVANKDLKAADVAKAFTLDAGSTSVDGAIIGGQFVTAAGHLGYTTATQGFSFTTEGAKFIATSDYEGAKKADSGGNVAGDRLKAVNTKLLDMTTQQGSDGSTMYADSYMIISGSANGGDSGVANFVLNDSKMDVITNFQVATDKLQIHKFDKDIPGKGAKFSALDVAANVSDLDGNGNADGITLTASGGGFTTNIVVSKGGESGGDVNLSGTITNGVVEFNTPGATLAQKLAALSGIAANKIVALKDGEDVYVIAGGNQTSLTSDDMVIKVTGIGNQISDVAGLLG